MVVIRLLVTLMLIPWFLLIGIAILISDIISGRIINGAKWDE